MLTAEEWFMVRTVRGAKMTGQTAFRTSSKSIKASDPTYVRGTGKTYYWCYGQQPEKAVVDLIARRCPVKAAEAYLRHFEYNPPDTWPQGSVKPVPKKR